MAKKVFICCGHGGSDPGAVANGFKEKDVNLVIGLEAMNQLIRHGVDVLISRTKDENDLLADVIKDCNNFNPNVAVDVHNNAGGGDGAEVYHDIKGNEDNALAQNILAEIVAIGQNSRGTKTKKNKDGNDYFGFIREIKAPSVIVECAFLDNKNDVKIIDTEEEQKAMGVAIAKGILKYLGIEWRENTPTRYAVQIGAYSDKVDAEKMLAKVEKAGFDGFIVTTNHEEIPFDDINVGDKVKMSKDATIWGKTSKFASWVYSSTLYVRDIDGDRVVISTQKTGAVTGATHKKYLTKIG